MTTPLLFDHRIPLLIDQWIDEEWEQVPDLPSILFTMLYSNWFALRLSSDQLLIAHTENIIHHHAEYAPVDPL